MVTPCLLLLLCIEARSCGKALLVVVVSRGKVMW